MSTRRAADSPGAIPAIRIGREELIERLEARRKWAEATDKANLAEHRKAEREAADRIKAHLKELQGLSYEQLKERVRYGEFRLEIEMPSCPRSWVGQLDSVLAPLKVSQQKDFTLDPGTMAHELLTHDDAISRGLC